jgi:phosphoenolpyruvate synthase/pyruvate phosphate dikinase
MREKYNKELTNFDFVTLTNQTKNKGIKSANIVHINDPSEIGKIEEDQVIVISEANPDYEMVAHKAAKNNCILITEIGGKLCHLAVVGREFKLVLIQFEDARSKLPEGYNCKVNLLEGKIEVLNEDTNTVLDRKINE